MTTLNEYRDFTQNLSVPVLANITEFGKTPLFTREELSLAGVALILYPLSAFRAMSRAALDVYQTILSQGTQRDAVPHMQTRDQLYDVLNYQAYEQQIDQLMEGNNGQ